MGNANLPLCYLYFRYTVLCLAGGSEAIFALVHSNLDKLLEYEGTKESTVKASPETWNF